MLQKYLLLLYNATVLSEEIISKRKVAKKA